MKEINNTKVFDGWHKQFLHKASTTHCEMRFAIFLPPQYEYNKSLPVLYWLSGLTCTDENFMQKAGAFKTAAELGVVIVAPDTSPRGDNIPDDPEGADDFGLGAGFYLDATESPWNRNYNMYSYISSELPNLIETEFHVSKNRCISGHSMGGHGALTIALKNPGAYISASAFSPICHPIQCPWGIKAFTHYLGKNKSLWENYDSSLLIEKSEKQKQLPILVDQGSNDNFLEEQLQPEALKAAAAKSAFPLTLRMQEGYDHSYYFISSFIEEHLRFHADQLKNS